MAPALHRWVRTVREVAVDRLTGRLVPQKRWMPLSQWTRQELNLPTGGCKPLRPPLALGPTVGAGSWSFGKWFDRLTTRLRAGLRRDCLRELDPTRTSHLQGAPPTPSPPRPAADRRGCLGKRKGRETCCLTPAKGRLYDARQCLGSHNSPPLPDVNAFTMHQFIANGKWPSTQKCCCLCLGI